MNLLNEKYDTEWNNVFDLTNNKINIADFIPLASVHFFNHNLNINTEEMLN